MWSSYQEMYMNIDNEKLLIDKRLEMVRFANDVGIKKTRNLNTFKTPNPRKPL